MISNKLSIQNHQGHAESSGAIDILAVDDHPDNLFLMQAILEEADYNLTCVNSGAAALDKISNNLPDLILLDVMMPDMTGYEVTKHIRKNPKTADVPILLVTAYDEVHESEVTELGANGLIKKPVDIDQLLADIRTVIVQARS
ncbi:MAG: response regulator [Cyanobacteria bacterium J06581_3]